MDLGKFTLADGQLPALSALLDALDLSSLVSANACLEGCDPILSSPHRLGEAVSTALLLDAVIAAIIWKHRTGKNNQLSINIIDAIHYLHPVHFVWQGNYNMDLGANFVHLNHCFKCQDGRHVWIQAGPPYPKLQDGYLDFFNCGNNIDAIQRQMLKWDPFALEDKMAELGLPCCVVRDKEEWRAHPQGQQLMHTPVIEIEKVADGQPAGLMGKSTAPLSGINVLDFTHVLAGPRSTMSLAEMGANVLHIAPPHHLDPKTINLGVNHGKKSAFLDLNDGEDLNQMKSLLTQADVFSLSYRPSVAKRFGLTVDEIKNLNPNGMVCLSINAYGHQGPWKDRPGFDQNAQMVSGFSVTEGSMEMPKPSPVYYINDLLTAYFAAAGMMCALYRRATDGGSYHVKVSLTKSCMWAQDLGLINKDDYSLMPEKDSFPKKLNRDAGFIYPPNLISESSAYGSLTRLAPAVTFSDMPIIKQLPVVPYGSCPATF